METISNIADAASKAIWGEGQDNTEPISGEKGAGTLDQPYDKGNEETSNTAAAAAAASDSKPAQKQQGADKPEAEPNATQTIAIKDTKSSIEDGKSENKNKPKMPHTDAEREELMKSGNFPHDPNDHSGEPLHVHDDSETKGDRKNSVGQEGGQPHGKGNGDQYVKSTGLAADGGDFDATNPGAGREATRLLGGKGYHKESDSDKAEAEDRSLSPTSDKSGKVSKIDKLKEKLHLKK